MRHHYQTQPDLQITPIEKIRLPLKSRDELPPILAGLQWIWMHPTLKAEIFALLEAKILAGKQATGCTGMDLWQILVLGVVRLGLDADWDRMEHVANYDSLVRQMLGVPATPWGEDAKVFGHQTLRDNVALLDDELLQQINARIAAAGREVFAKKGGAPVAALEVKVDSYVLEADVHFPTDLNLLWDAGRKCVDLVEQFRRSGCALPGWRKANDWRRQLKNLQRTTSQIVYRGGPNKEARVKSAVRGYLAVGRASRSQSFAPACWNCATSPWTSQRGKRSNTSSGCSPSTWIWWRAGCCTGKRFRPTRKCFPSSSRTRSGFRKASNARTWNWGTSSCSRPTSSS